MYIVTTEPADPVCDLDEIKAQLVIDNAVTSEDSLLEFLEQANSQFVAFYLQRILPITEVKVRAKITGKQALKVPTPCNSIVSIKSYVSGVEDDTIAEDDYEVLQYQEPHIIAPKSGIKWPDCDYLDITLSCGYVKVPVIFKQAILIRIADQYENRTEQVRDRMNNVTEMLHMYRISEFQSIPPPPLIEKD